MAELTVFIISCGEESLEECKTALDAQELGGLDVKVDVIKDVRPMSEAFNEMHRRATTPYFIQVDADMILKAHAVRALYDGVKASWPWTYAVLGQLYEEGFGVGGMCKCWKASFFRLFQFRDSRTVDRDLFNRARRLGFRRKKLDGIVGIHRPRYSEFSEYLKTKSDVEKWRFLGRRASQYALPLYDELIGDPEANRFLLFGALLGAAMGWDRVRRSKDIIYERELLDGLLSELGIGSLSQLRFAGDSEMLRGPVRAEFEESYEGRAPGGLLSSVVRMFGAKGPEDAPLRRLLHV